jgi:hypothetical protein
MKCTFSFRFAIARQFFIFAVICGFGFQNQAIGQNSETAHWQHLKYAIYFTSQDVDSLLS